MILAYIDPITKLLGIEETLGGITIWSIIARFLLTLICAGFIGIERARRRHAAGLRTYILVSLGSMIVTFTNQYIYEAFEGSDVSRLAAQVISGIGFLGAGTILITSKSQIKGLTTAAGLWVAACIGIAIGIGFYTLAIVGTIVVMFAFLILPQLEIKLTKGSFVIEIHVELFAEEDLKKLVDFIRSNGGKINHVNYNSAFAKTGLSVYTIHLMSWTKHSDDLIKNIRELDYVNFAEVIL